MGKNYQGINGNFSGKIGPTVGRQSKGRTITAIYQPIVKNPRTVKQETNRAKFALVVDALHGLAGWAKQMCKNLTKYGNGYSNLLKINMDGDVIGGSYPNFEFLANKAELSRGILGSGYSPTAVVDSQTLNASWTDDTDNIINLSTDRANLAVYNAARKQWLYNFTAGTRSDRQSSMNLPTAWSGDSIDVYIAFSRPDFSEVSNSVYLGNLSI